jgi:Domain of unknown function (DUF4136)
MHKSIALLVLLATLGLAACSSGKLFVENDYSYEGHFKNYRSFNFLECEFVDSTLLCSDIQDAIRHQMEARGYKVSNRAPNLLITYNIFRSDLRFRGYQQPVIKDWVVREDDDATYKRIDYNLDEGTLMISLIDAQSYQVIWKGYASKMLRNANFKNNYFKGIVRSIFDQYPLMASNDADPVVGR